MVKFLDFAPNGLRATPMPKYGPKSGQKRIPNIGAQIMFDYNSALKWANFNIFA